MVAALGAGRAGVGGGRSKIYSSIVSGMTDPAVAYTDGSCIGNPGPGGWGVHVEFPDGRVVERGGGDVETTNNRMELRAAIEAVRLTAEHGAARVITDSQYVRNGVTHWVEGWKRNGWQTSARRPVENLELWTELDALNGDRVQWEWTRAHVGTAGNERCDAIARWFAGTVRRLEPNAEPSPRPVAPGRSTAPGTVYLSLVDGIVARHGNWSDCERRVRGVRGARFKKARNPDEEHAIVQAWGLPPNALEFL